MVAGEALWNSGLVNLLARLGKELEVEIRELMSPLNISFIFFFFSALAFSDSEVHREASPRSYLVSQFILS